MSKYRSLALAMVISTSALAMASAANAESVLRVANFGEPDTLDPQNMSGTWENRISGDMFLGLTTEAADGKVIPGAATDWKISEDGLTYTFKIRDNLNWSDGVPVTADDFVFSYRRILDPKQAAKYASLLYTIKGAEEINSGKETDFLKLGAKAIDSKTLEVTLKEPAPYFLQQLTHYTAFPLPKHVVEKHGKEWVKSGNMVSNGPYMLQSHTPNDTVVLVKNPKFYEAAKVKIDKVVFYAADDRSEMEKRYRAGEIDIVTDINTQQLDRLKKDYPNELKISAYLGNYYYVFNTAKGVTADPKVRQALTMAMDREILTEKVSKAGEIPAYGIVPPGIDNYSAGNAEPAWKKLSKDQRLAEAKKLLAEAGYTAEKPLKITLSYNTSESHKALAVAVQAMWKQSLGVQAELTNADTKTHYNNLRDGTFDVARAGWIADYNDPQNFLYLFETRTGSNNYGKFSNAEYDKLMVDAGKEVDLKKRAQILKKAEQIAIDGYAWSPMYYYVSKNIVSPRVKGFVANTKDTHRTRWMEIAAK
ncbi:peptide ABC transporter substrate-binding protein [Lacibacterium aquatile]|uniref:Peptide ABC transporter substrate-binding protein n=1 Tax=Lacibacterium aquatile TaxID=1168082 RepID=A0ABW5DNR1_9PROT